MGEDGRLIPTPIDSSNLGFKLLKKCGWKEGTGLGVDEQGDVEPVEIHVKANKRGIGADKLNQKKKQCVGGFDDDKTKHKDHSAPRKKSKALSKRISKMLEEEKRAQEAESARAFFREFWPENV